MAEQPDPTFHVVAVGEAWLEVDGVDEQARLAAGDLAVLAGGARPTLRDRPDTSAPPFEEVLLRSPIDERRRMRHGGGGAPATLLCGSFGVEGGRPSRCCARCPLIASAGRRAVSVWNPVSGDQVGVAGSARLS